MHIYTNYASVLQPHRRPRTNLGLRGDTKNSYYAFAYIILSNMNKQRQARASFATELLLLFRLSLVDMWPSESLHGGTLILLYVQSSHLTHHTTLSHASNTQRKAYETQKCVDGIDEEGEGRAEDDRARWSVGSA